MPHRRRNYAEEQTRSKREREAVRGIGPSMIGAADGLVAGAFKLLLLVVVLLIASALLG